MSAVETTPTIGVAPRSTMMPMTSTRSTALRRRWLRNQWEELAFVHWAYPPEVVQALLPDGLTVDTFDGDAYVSLVPFRMVDAAPRWVPAVPWLSTFLETNVRTYVVDSAGNRAIWFFSLEATRLPIVVFARRLLGFPYVWTDLSLEIDGDWRRYESWKRRLPSRPESSTAVGIKIGEQIAEASPLDVFLTARWGTVTEWPRGSGRLFHHPVDHGEWQLHDARLVEYHDESFVAAGLPEPADMPIVRFAQTIDATFGLPERV